jgi:hypothetical protein
MAVTSTTLSGVNVFQFSGAVTDAEIGTAFASTISEGRYVLNRAIYLDQTADLTNVTGGFLIDFGTQVMPAIILDTRRDRTKSVFKNFVFYQRVGLSVLNRNSFVRTWNGTGFANAGSGLSIDGLAQNGGGFFYAVQGVNPGPGDNRWLNEMAFAGPMANNTVASQQFALEELQVCMGASTTIKGMTFEKAYGFPQLSPALANANVSVYRSNMNTESLVNGGLIPIRLFPSFNRWASVCYVDSYVTRLGADITTRLVDAFGSNATSRAHFTVLNNYTRESWFGVSKTNMAITTWGVANTIHGGVLKKLQFINGSGGVVRAYDSRSTTASQPCKFSETGFFDFLDPSLAPTVDSEGKIELVHIGAIASGATAAIARYNSQKVTFQKFGYRVRVATVDMTSGDNDLSAFTPVILTEQSGIVRTQAAINAAASITSFQDLLEELHVLAIGLVGAQSYNGYATGNLFTFEAGELKTNFANVIVDATAASKIAYNFATNTLTIKASIITGTNDVIKWNNSIGIITLVNGSQIQGVYQDSTGTSTVLEISGFDAGSAVYVEDNNAVQKYYNASVSGTVTLYIPPTATGEWYYAVEKYGNQRQSDFFTFSGGFKAITVKALTDVGITQTNPATVAAYTELENPDKVYDRVAYARLSVPFISYGQIVFRDGNAIYLEQSDMVVKQTASAIVAFNYTTKVLTVKAASMEPGAVYKTIITDPPATIEADTNEVISVNVEDANGDSNVNIQGGSGNFTLWKLPNATPNEDYATGVNLGTAGNGIFRFLSSPGYKLFIFDTGTLYGQDVPMDKGYYEAALFFGPQVALAQAGEVTQINSKVDLLQVLIEAIQGTGFVKDVNSLTNTPTIEDISEQVWVDQPDRLKEVSTVHTTGSQLAAYKS